MGLLQAGEILSVDNVRWWAVFTRPRVITWDSDQHWSSGLMYHQSSPPININSRPFEILWAVMNDNFNQFSFVALNICSNSHSWDWEGQHISSPSQTILLPENSIYWVCVVDVVVEDVYIGDVITELLDEKVQDIGLQDCLNIVTQHQQKIIFQPKIFCTQYIGTVFWQPDLFWLLLYLFYFLLLLWGPLVQLLID